MFSESVKMVPVVISENDTFESVILESVKIESVGVDAHDHCLPQSPFFVGKNHNGKAHKAVQSVV